MSRGRLVEVKITEKQKELLEQICRRQNSTQQQLRRAQIIVKASEGLSNKKIAKELGVHRSRVRQWRGRWLVAEERLAGLETKENNKTIFFAIEEMLCDAYRSGTPSKFSSEQIVEIMALACEAPSLSNRPISHWTPRELADEAIKRGMVESISAQSVERFLKGSRPQATSVTLLANKRTEQRP
jgi:putative transposase